MKYMGAGGSRGRTPFSAPALDEGKWSASGPGRITQGKKKRPLPTRWETGRAPEPIWKFYCYRDSKHALHHRRQRHSIRYCAQTLSSRKLYGFRRCWDSSVCKRLATVVEGSGFEHRRVREIFSSPRLSKPALGPTQLSV